MEIGISGSAASICTGRPHPRSKMATAAPTRSRGQPSAAISASIACGVFWRAISCTCSAAGGRPPGFPLTPFGNGRPGPRRRLVAAAALFLAISAALRRFVVRRNPKSASSALVTNVACVREGAAVPRCGEFLPVRNTRIVGLVGSVGFHYHARNHLWVLLVLWVYTQCRERGVSGKRWWLFCAS
jgi:hypothetical protein